MDLSVCIVNTNGRADLLRCLGSVRDTMPAGIEAEVLVLDNASEDGSVAAAMRWNASEGLGERLRVLPLERRAGKAANDSLLLREARGRYCLLLNEDSEVLPGAIAALLGALVASPRAAVAGAQLLGPDGSESACAWRLPGVGVALAQAALIHRFAVTQSGGGRTRRVGWVQSAAMLVRRAAAEEVSFLDSAFFVYSDETDFQKRLDDAGWEVLYVPEARAVHHEQLTHDRSAGERRVVEFHRNRDLYMRKHHGRGAAMLVRALVAWSYAVRALAAGALPDRDPAWFWLHARKALRPGGEGIREAVEEHNRLLDRAARGEPE